MRLNLGCGDDIRKDYINVDLYNKKADKKINLSKIPYPFKDNSVDQILALNILEHLDDPYNILLEWNRICKKGAKIIIQVPHFTSGNAWADIQHRRPFSIKSFSNENMQDYFKVKRCKVEGQWSWLGNLFPRLWEYGLAFIFPSGDLHVILEVRK
tara:strand:+ start:30 stop:494 length:465 start_codon:yes stop_codon:yes gene_type:complete